MKKIKTNQLLREQLHIRQEDFAIYLGVSRSLLSLYEKGLRSLPAEALIKLGNLGTLYDQNSQKKGSASEHTIHPEIKKHEEKIKNEFELNGQICSYKRKKLERQLNEMVDKHTRARAWGDLLTVLLDPSVVSRNANKDCRFLEVQKQKVIKKLVRFGNASQAKLQVKIEMLKAEEQANKKWADII